MTIRLMAKSMLETDTYHYIKSVRIEFQENNGKHGSFWVMMTDMNNKEFSVEFEPTREIIDVWND